MRSLRSSLLTSTLSTAMLVWLIVSGLVIWSLRNEVNAVFDAHLLQSSRVLLSLISGELIEEYSSPTEPVQAFQAGLDEIAAHLSPHRYATELAFQFSVGKGAMNFHSARAPTQPFSNDVDGFTDVNIDGKGWRVYTAHDSTGVIVVRIAELHDIRRRLVDELTLRTFLPPLAGMLALGLLVWQSVRWSVTPLDRLAEAIRQREPDRFDLLDTAKVLPEVRPIIDSLNGLMTRLGRLLENERRFTADAAHELRTPLAGLKAQAQLALRTDSSETRRKALQAIDTAVTRAAHVVDQLLALARLDSLPAMARRRVDLTAVAREAAGISDPGEDRHRVTIETSGPLPIVILGDTDALWILCRNLIDNAIRHSPVDGRVVVTVAGDAGLVTLTVDDEGPGIPEAERSRVIERFYRRAARGVEGVGLGLSIVHRIAEMHGARLSLGESPAGGLRAIVTFDPAQEVGTETPVTGPSAA